MSGGQVDRGIGHGHSEARAASGRCPGRRRVGGHFNDLFDIGLVGRIGSVYGQGAILQVGRFIADSPVLRLIFDVSSLLPGLQVKGRPVQKGGSVFAVLFVADLDIEGDTVLSDRLIGGGGSLVDQSFNRVVGAAGLGQDFRHVGNVHAVVDHIAAAVDAGDGHTAGNAGEGLVVPGPDPGLVFLVVAALDGCPVSRGIGGDDSDITEGVGVSACKLHDEAEGRIGWPVVVSGYAGLRMQEVKYGLVLRGPQGVGGVGRIDHGHLRELDIVGIIEDGAFCRLDFADLAVCNLRGDYVIGVVEGTHQVKGQAPGSVGVGRGSSDLLSVVVDRDRAVFGGLAGCRDGLKARPGGHLDGGRLYLHIGEADGLHDVFPALLKGQVGIGLFAAGGGGHDIEANGAPGLAGHRDSDRRPSVLSGLRRAGRGPAIHGQAVFLKLHASRDLKPEHLVTGFILTVDLIGGPHGHVLGGHGSGKIGPEAGVFFHCVVEFRLVEIRDGDPVLCSDQAVLNLKCLFGIISPGGQTQIAQLAEGISPAQHGGLFHEDNGVLTCWEGAGRIGGPGAAGLHDPSLRVKYHDSRAGFSPVGRDSLGSYTGQGDAAVLDQGPFHFGAAVRVQSDRLVLRCHCFVPVSQGQAERVSGRGLVLPEGHVGVLDSEIGHIPAGRLIVNLKGQTGCGREPDRLRRLPFGGGILPGQGEGDPVFRNLFQDGVDGDTAVLHIRF